MSLLIELFAGTGVISRAFAERGWSTCGIDIHRDHSWPPELPHLELDIHTLQTERREINSNLPADHILIWASPPCQEYSHAARRAPGFQPDLRLWHTTLRLATALRCPYIIENVNGAQKWWGPAANHFGKTYLWGSGVPPLLPQGPRWKDRTAKSQHRSPRLRAVIPNELVQAIADFHAR